MTCFTSYRGIIWWSKKRSSQSGTVKSGIWNLNINFTVENNYWNCLLTLIILGLGGWAQSLSSVGRSWFLRNKTSVWPVKSSRKKTGHSFYPCLVVALQQSSGTPFFKENFDNFWLNVRFFKSFAWEVSKKNRALICWILALNPCKTIFAKHIKHIQGGGQKRLRSTFSSNYCRKAAINNCVHGLYTQSSVY